MDCNIIEHRCGGGRTQRALGWVADNGLYTEECLKYKSDMFLCSTECDAGSKDQFEVYNKFEAVVYENDTAQVEELIKEFQTGPVYMSLPVHKDFMVYKNGVYRVDEEEEILGTHAVKCLGWGPNVGEPDYDPEGEFTHNHHWYCANTWGTHWGQKGYFQIAMDQKIGYNAGYNWWNPEKIPLPPQFYSQ